MKATTTRTSSTMSDQPPPRLREIAQPAKPGMPRISHASSIVRRAIREAKRRAAPVRNEFLSFLAEAGRDDKDAPLDMSDPYIRLVGTLMPICRAQGRHFAHVTPPGLGKSTLARQFFVFEIGRNNQLRTVTISGDETAACDSVSLCRQIVLSASFKKIFPEARPDYQRSRNAQLIKSEGSVRDERGWRRDGWFLQAAGQRKDPTMAAVAAMPKREDIRADMLLADDIVTERIANSAADRKAVERAFWNTWLEGRLSNGGWCCYLQNMRVKGDLAHQLRDDPRFCSLWIGVTEDCEHLFVRVWNPPTAGTCPPFDDPAAFDMTETDPDPLSKPDREFLMPLPRRASWRKEVLMARSPVAFRQLYRLQAFEPTDLMFPHFMAAHIGGGHPGATIGCSWSGTLPALPPHRRGSIRMSVGLDWSSGKRRGKALTMLGLDGNSGLITPLVHQRILGSPQDVIDVLERLWGAGLCWEVLMAESNAIQDELNNALRILGKGRDWIGTIKDFATVTGAKLNIEHGLPALDVEFETGKFVWPENASRISTDWALLENEMAELTRLQASTPGQMPDGPMTVWFAYRGLRRRPGFVSVGPGEKTKSIPVGSRSGPLGRF
jgi:hypothetical protein